MINTLTIHLTQQKTIKSTSSTIKCLWILLQQKIQIQLLMLCMCAITIGCARTLLTQTQPRFRVTRSDECFGCKLASFVASITQYTIGTFATSTKVIGFAFF